MTPNGQVRPEPSKVGRPEPDTSIFIDKGINPIKLVMKAPTGFGLKKIAKPSSEPTASQIFGFVKGRESFENESCSEIPVL